MSRVATRAFQTLLDVVALAAAFLLAFMVRFDWQIPQEFMRRCFVLLPYVVVIKYLVLHWFDVPRFSWRYIGLREVVRIFQALAVSSAILLTLRLITTRTAKAIPFIGHVWVPLGIIAIDLTLAFGLIVGLRAIRRLRGEQVQTRAAVPVGEGVATLMIGAGEAGLQVAKQLATRRELGLRPVGFLDDDRTKIGTFIHGVPVLGATEDVERIAAECGARQVLITISAANGRHVRQIMAKCETTKLPVKIIPPTHEIVGGQVSLSRMRDVAIEDLLRREAVRLDETALREAVTGHVVLVTGAGGSIGSELCRQLCGFNPKSLILVERAENALFEIHRELLRTHPDIELVPLIGDVTDVARMRSAFVKYRPSFVLHAAAHKHVPMMEWNPGEALKNNVFGTKNIAELSHEHAVKMFVLISTDKAVNPTSVMGASKRVAELFVQALSSRSKTRFVAVRFGNVLGSTGSVIPIFREQISRGGPVTVTHPEMTRYFMTIPEASQLVLQAATMGKGGEIFILDMGEPVRIVDLAEDLIRLSGLRPGEDVEVQFTGARPGEKLFEELSVADENADKTYHPKIFVGRLPVTPFEMLSQQLDQLSSAVDELEVDSVRDRLRRIVPEFAQDVAEARSARLAKEEVTRRDEVRISVLPALEQG
ncbi:MAG: polysaccharide biosynthesis protein [Polyangiaceae bacterium]|nr:polysaccharide biosynthesis protein [Polyangiaceae bacterium]